MPPNLKVSASLVDLKANQKPAQNSPLESTQSDNITMASQTEPEDAQTPGRSTQQNVSTSSGNCAKQKTPLTALQQHRGKRISFTDENNESSNDLMVPTPAAVEQPSTSSSVFKVPFSAVQRSHNKNMPQKFSSNKTLRAPTNDEKRPRLENHQGKNLVGYKVSLPNGLSGLGVHVNKSDGNAYVYGFARNIAFAIVLIDSQRKNIFKCHIPNCSIQIMDEVLMLKHIESCHNGQAWNSYCAKCSKVFFFPEKSTVTMLDEYDHIKEHHFKMPLEKRANNVTSIGKNMAAFNIPQTPPVVKNDHVYRNRSMSIAAKPCMDPRINRSLHGSTSDINLEQFYNSIDTINLRPWLNDPAEFRKSKAASLAMLHEDPLAAFFKCMSKNCIYYTSDAENFRRHLSLHKSFNNVCSYCSYSSTSIESLIKHLQDEHSFDCYQCGFCFYRSLTEGNVLIHKKHHHDKKSSAVIIEVMRRGYKDRADRLCNEARAYDNISKFVSKLMCACGVDFYLFNDFEMHIKEHGNRKLNYFCKKCNRNIPLQDLAEHHEKCLKQSYIQCIYCQFGCQNSSKINEHLTNYHASKVLMYCDRTDSPNVRNYFFSLNYFNINFCSMIRALTNAST